jgi:integrase
MATINFTLSTKMDGRKKQVMVRFTHSKINQRAKSGIFVDPTYWDDTKQTVVMPRVRLMTEEMQRTISELREADSRLRELRLFIEDAYHASPISPAQDKEWLKGVVSLAIYGEQEEDPAELDFWGVWDLFIENKMVSAKRKQMYRAVSNMLRRFEAVKRKKTPSFTITLDSFTPFILSDFEAFLYNEEEYTSLYPDIYKGVRMCSRTGGVNRGLNTISGRLEIFRTFYNWVVDRELSSNNPFAKYKIKQPVYGTPIYISKEERDILLNAEMPSQSLSAVRDIFIFQCCVGCRVGDLLKFTKDNIIDGAIEYVASKTRDNRPRTVRVPLNSIAKTILARHDDPKRAQLLPFISEQKYNIYIKKCFKVAGLTRAVTIPDTKTGQTKQVALCDYASSHMARRTFAGILYEQVQDPNLISALTGHTDASRAFARYRDVTDTLKRKTVELLE